MNKHHDKQKAVEDEIRGLWAMLPEHTRELFKRIKAETENQDQTGEPKKEG